MQKLGCLLHLSCKKTFMSVSVHISYCPSVYRSCTSHMLMYVHMYHMWGGRRSSGSTMCESEVGKQKRCLLITLNYNDPARLRCSNHRFHYSRTFCVLRRHTCTDQGDIMVHTHAHAHTVFSQPPGGRLNEAESTKLQTVTLPNSVCVCLVVITVFVKHQHSVCDSPRTGV